VIATPTNRSPKAALTAACAAMSLAHAGCYGTEATRFPDGLEPWEENTAALPAPTADDACPEQLVFVRGGYMSVRSVHARACIHRPIATVWRAVRDPQTGRDSTRAGSWRVLEYETEPTYDYSYKTYLFVDDIVDVDFQLSWRHGVVEGTDELPTLTATRWQKTFGTTAISTMEGSLILRPLEGSPEITVAEYQYHLASAASDHGTIEAFLAVIYGRLRDRSHGRPLSPDDCTECPAAPEGY
jgi:hypothetical protein